MPRRQGSLSALCLPLRPPGGAFGSGGAARGFRPGSGRGPSLVPRFLGPAASVFLAAVLCLSCSVKEDREACPCRLILDFGSLAESGMLPSALFLSGKGLEYADTIEVPDTEELYAVDVPKGQAQVSVVHGDEGLFTPGRGLEIMSGAQCPELWLYSALLTLSGETCRDTVRLHKNYCCLDVTVRDGGGKGLGYPFYVEVAGNVNGCDGGGVPTEGAFLVSCRPGKDGTLSVRVPRQVDSSLRLDITAQDGTLRSFALGEYIAGTGYDWTQADLDDLAVEIDYAATRVALRVVRWQESLSFEIVV